MKILQVNCVYQKGSTGKITYDLHKGLQEAGIESVVCYGRGEKIRETGVYKTCPEWNSKLSHALTKLTGIMYGGEILPTAYLIQTIRREKPDIVHLQCINGYFVNIYKLLRWLKRHKIKTVLTLHAEFMHTGGCGHALECDRWLTGCGNCPRWKRETGSLFFDRTAAMHKRMKKAFEGFEDHLKVVSVSPWLQDRAAKSPILSAMDHSTIFNGLNCDVFHPYDTTDLRQNHGIQNEKILFHATPAFSSDPAHIKGGYHIIALARKLLDEGSNAKIIVAGPYPKDLVLPPNMIMLGRVADQALLAQYYSVADVTVLASKRETFSMICAESLCCGTPVVGFEAGAPERISISEYSAFVPYGDGEALYGAVETMLKQGKSPEIVMQAVRWYDRRIMTQAYIDLYRSML